MALVLQFSKTVRPATNVNNGLRDERAGRVANVVALKPLETKEIVKLLQNEVKSYPMLSAEQETELVKAIANGDRRAKDELIRSNLRLVINLAKSYGQDDELIDLIQAGNKGLQKAASKFSLECGQRFGTYASWWIRNAIVNAMSNKSATAWLPAS